MRYIFYLALCIVAVSCANHAFDADSRQIAAKDEIASKLRRGRGFNVLSFSQDTLQNYPDTLFKKPIQYSLNITYQDSNNVEQHKKGIVIFTHDGNSIIKSMITDSLP